MKLKQNFHSFEYYFRLKNRFFLKKEQNWHILAGYGMLRMVSCRFSFSMSSLDTFYKRALLKFTAHFLTALQSCTQKMDLLIWKINDNFIVWMVFLFEDDGHFSIWKLLHRLCLSVKSISMLCIIMIDFRMISSTTQKLKFFHSKLLFFK